MTESLTTKSSEVRNSCLNAKYPSFLNPVYPVQLFNGIHPFLVKKTILEINLSIHYSEFNPE